MPTIATPVEIDKQAGLTDVFGTHTGFTLTHSFSWPTTLEGNRTIIDIVTIRNDSASCGATHRLTNIVTLTKKDTLGTKIATAFVDVYTGPCPPPVVGNCKSHGYWKNHQSAWPQGSYSKFYRTNLSWMQVLRTPPKGDAYYILAYQFIAAHLNKASGCSMPADVLAAYNNAASFFTNNSPGLTGGKISAAQKYLRQSALKWAETLEK
jgi:hypothetical protein